MKLGHLRSEITSPRQNPNSRSRQVTSPLELRPQEEENCIATTESELTEHSDADRNEASAGEALS